MTPDGPAKRVLVSRPGARLKVSYRVVSAYSSDPPGGEGNPYRGAVIRPGWFATLGDYIFAAPEGRETSPASFRWGALPSGWVAASELDDPGLAGSLTVTDVIDSTLVGGADVTLVRRRLADGGELRLAIRGAWPVSGDHLADTLASTVEGVRRFWGDRGGSYFVSAIPLAAQPGELSLGGTSKTNGFALYATPNAPEAKIQRMIAHEYSHIWIPRALGALPEGPEQAGAYWLSEGGNDFFTDRALLRAGLWSPQDLVRHLNEVLRAYAASPVRTAPNSRIIADFWRGGAVSQLPYQRGYLLAFLLDTRLSRAKPGGGGLDTVLFDMRDRYRAAPRDAKPDLVASFRISASRVAGVDVGADIERFIDKGEAITLPSDLVPGCVAVADVAIPVFDLGFDLPATRERGTFVGIDPSGPAYRAGLRDGMTRLSVAGGQADDSRAVVTYRVRDAAGADREISYRPEGRTIVTFQEARLIADPHADPSCRLQAPPP